MAVNKAVTDMESASGHSDAGSVDNRLTINPNDKRWTFAADWADGNDYTVKVKLRQISPGEFEVVSMQTISASKTETPPAKPGKVSNAVKAMEEESGGGY